MDPTTTLVNPMSQVKENLEPLTELYPDAMKYVLEPKICKACGISSLLELTDLHKEILINALNSFAKTWNMTSRITPFGDSYELNFQIPITIEGREQVGIIESYSSAITAMMLQMCMYMRFV